MEESSIILGLSGKKDRFRLRYGWITLHLSIKPLTARQVIEIGEEIAKIGQINPEEEMVTAFFNNTGSLRYVATCIAIATGTRWRRLVTKAVLDLPLKDIEKLFNHVRLQADMERFFFIMISTKGMNLKGRKEEQ